MNTQATDAKMSKANAPKQAIVKGAKSAKSDAPVQPDAIVPPAPETAQNAAFVPFPAILYPRTDSKGEPRKQKPYISTDGRTLHAKIGGVELKMLMPESDSISIYDQVPCVGTKVSSVSTRESYCIDSMPFQVPAVIFFANALAGMAERLNTNAESRDAFEAQLQAWSGCYPMPSDEKALNTRPAFTWGSFLATYQPTPEQEPIWNALRGKTTTELAKLTKGLRERCDWLRDAMDAAGYTEPTQVAIPDDLAALLG